MWVLGLLIWIAIAETLHHEGASRPIAYVCSIILFPIGAIVLHSRIAKAKKKAAQESTDVSDVPAPAPS